jgi:hypothetical protein
MSYILGILAGGKINQEIWGLVLISIPTSAGIGYLLFSTMLMLFDYFRLPATFVKNSERAPLWRTLSIATVPVRQRISLVIAVICCTISFQAAMVGRTSATTTGSQIQRGLKTPDLPLDERILLLSTSIASLIITLFVVTLIISLTLRFVGFAAVRSPAQQTQGHFPTNSRTLKIFVATVILVSLAISVALHVFLILRLTGLSHGLFNSLGLPTGQLEQTWPSMSGVWDLLADAPDPALAGAVVGFMACMYLWFIIAARSGPPPRPGLATYGPPFFACLAFVPSSFVGSLFLALPELEGVTGFLLFLWGLMAAAGLTCLLISHQLLAGRVERFANLQRLEGRSRAAWYFAREYWLFGLAVFLAVVLGNVFDSGYREKMGLPSLGAHFANRDIIWPPGQRGLALAILFLAILIVWVLAQQGVRKPDTKARSEQ